MPRRKRNKAQHCYHSMVPPLIVYSRCCVIALRVTRASSGRSQAGGIAYSVPRDRTSGDTHLHQRSQAGGTRAFCGRTSGGHRLRLKPHAGDARPTLQVLRDRTSGDTHLHRRSQAGGTGALCGRTSGGHRPLTEAPCGGRPRTTHESVHMYGFFCGVELLEIRWNLVKFGCVCFGLFRFPPSDFVSVIFAPTGKYRLARVLRVTGGSAKHQDYRPCSRYVGDGKVEPIFQAGPRIAGASSRLPCQKSRGRRR